MDETNQSSADQAQPQLQLNDLLFVLQILQTAAQRGVFRVDEFKPIGECYERLFAFLAAHGVVKSANQQETPSTTNQA